MRLHLLLAAVSFGATLSAAASPWSTFDKGPNYEIYINLNSVRPLGDSTVRFQTVTNYESVMRYERLWYRSMTLTRTVDCRKKLFKIESASIFSKFFGEGQYLLNPRFPQDARTITVNSATERLYDVMCSQYRQPEKKTQI